MRLELNFEEEVSRLAAAKTCTALPGEANVLSTSSFAPTAWAISDSFSMSATRNIGLLIVSTTIICVCSFTTA